LRHRIELFRGIVRWIEFEWIRWAFGIQIKEILMNCPVCNVALTMSDRQGVEIDYCPKCRGVWLDRGELDKIIERAATDRADVRDKDQRENYQEPHREHYKERYDDDDDERHRYDRHGRKRRSFLGDIFDFD
jgi:uncharacterized protein